MDSLQRPLFLKTPTLLLLPAQVAATSRRVIAAPHAAVAEKMAGSASQWKQPAGKGLGFYTGEDGYLYCDNLRVDDIRKEVGFVTSNQDAAVRKQQ